MKRTFVSLLSLVFLVSGGLLFAGGAAEEQTDEPVGRVVLATASPTAEVEEQIAEFNEIYPDIRVETLFMGVGESFSRVQAERGNPTMDVWTGGGVGFREAICELMSDYVSTEDAAFPDHLKGPECGWYGQNAPPQIFLLNTDILTEDEMPRTWADLADPKWEGEIILANPALSSSSFNQVQMLLHIGGWDLVEAVVNNAVITPSSRLAWQGVADGEFAIGMATENTVITLEYNDYPVTAYYPEDGVNENLTVVSLLDNSPNPANARRLYDFLNSRVAHEIIVQPPHFRRAVRPDVELHELMTPTAELNFAVTEEDLRLSAEERAEILDRFDDIMAGVGREEYDVEEWAR